MKADFDDIARGALLQNDISIEFRTPEGKKALQVVLDMIKEVERLFPTLGEYLTQAKLQEALRTPEPMRCLTSFMQEDRVLIKGLEDILSIDGGGRPEKARELLNLLRTVDRSKLEAEVERIGQRRFL